MSLNKLSSYKVAPDSVETVGQLNLVVGVVYVCVYVLTFNYIARYHSSSGKLKLTEELLSLGPMHVTAAYTLNPLTIATCAAMSTGVFHNFILSLVFLFILRGTLLTPRYLLFMMYVSAFILWVLLVLSLTF